MSIKFLETHNSFRLQSSDLSNKHQNRWGISVIQLVFSSSLFFSCFALGQEHNWQSKQYIIDSFIDIALNNEYSNERSVVRRWAQPIYYDIDHRTGDQALHEQLTLNHLSHLSSITSVRMSPASSEHNANLKIIFSSELNLEHDLHHDFLLKNPTEITQLLHHGVCLGRLWLNKKNQIYQATVIIPVDRARAHAKLLACIVEELTQVMGLPNDSDKVFPSIFNDKSKDDYLSGLDFILLKLLYHPSLHAGMDNNQVRQQLKLILANKEFEELISNAEQIVQKQGLYPLLN